MFDNCEIIKRRQKSINRELEYIVAQEKGFPNGEIICSKNEDRYKWFIKNNNERKYLAKSNKDLAEQLAIKKYLLNKKQELLCEMKANEAYIRKMKKRVNKSDEMLNHPEYARLLERHFVSNKKELKEWQSETYIKNQNHIENLIVKGTQGKKLRSKSEAIIDRMLYTYKIPFRYEERLILGDMIIYPDFVIRHPKTGEYYYWEHFGMMDDKAYINSACEKMKLYSENGIYPSINLIMTFETKNNPLSIDEVEQIINKYFL